MSENTKPVVNQNCIGCGACAQVSEVFEMNDDLLSEVVELETYDDPSIEDAINVCPVSAISR